MPPLLTNDDRASNSDGASLPLIADPAAGAIIGTVLLFFGLMVPGSLILMLVVGLGIGIFRGLRSSHGKKTDAQFAARFRDLEDRILDTDGEERQ